MSEQPMAAFYGKRRYTDSGGTFAYDPALVAEADHLRIVGLTVTLDGQGRAAIGAGIAIPGKPDPAYYTWVFGGVLHVAGADGVYAPCIAILWGDGGFLGGDFFSAFGGAGFTPADPLSVAGKVRMGKGLPGPVQDPIRPVCGGVGSFEGYTGKLGLVFVAHGSAVLDVI